MQANLLSVLHIITGLHCGGAEMMLYKLLSSLPRERYSSHVISLRPHGTVEDKIVALGVPVFSPNMRGMLPTPRSVLDLRRLTQSIQPQIIQGWMYHGNLAAIVAARSLPYSCPVIWNIRSTLYGVREEKLMSRIVTTLSAWLSRKPVQLIYNSIVAKSQHEAEGFSDLKSLVIPNGINCSLFVPSSQRREQIRTELGIPNAAFVIGHVARFHQMKAHDVFFQAAHIFSQRHPGTHYVLVGEHVEENNQSLYRQGAQMLEKSCLHLLGERQDVERIFAGCDIATLTSRWGEAFPNVVGEAMACGLPCVVTDVGDSAKIVQDLGVVVPVDDPQALAKGWEKLFLLPHEERQFLSVAAREHIINSYSLEMVAARYEQLYESVVSDFVLPQEQQRQQQRMC